VLDYLLRFAFFLAFFFVAFFLAFFFVAFFLAFFFVAFFLVAIKISFFNIGFRFSAPTLSQYFILNMFNVKRIFMIKLVYEEIATAAFF